MRSLVDVVAFQGFGEIKHSHTLPSLCSAVVPQPAVAHLSARLTVHCRDFNGEACKSGGDPITVLISDASGRAVHHAMIDKENGSYDVLFTPPLPDTYSIVVKIFDRHIQGSPFECRVSEHINPVSLYSGGDVGLLRPVNIVKVRCNRVPIKRDGKSLPKKNLYCQTNRESSKFVKKVSCRASCAASHPTNSTVPA